MKLIPAIDLKDQQCVRLQKGRLKDIKVFNTDPLAQAKFFQDKGCERIHIVDLDGAFGSEGVNTEIILNIRKNVEIPIELGGGIKDEKDISFWINHGIDYLILGSVSINKKDLVLKAIEKHANRIYIALDILNEKAMISGWVEESELTAKDIFKIYDRSPINGYILTDVSRDGMLVGLNFELIKKLISNTEKNIIVGGGLAEYSDIKVLKNSFAKSNIEGFIAGKSIYSGQIDIEKAMKLLNSKNSKNA